MSSLYVQSFLLDWVTNIHPSHQTFALKIILVKRNKTKQQHYCSSDLNGYVLFRQFPVSPVKQKTCETSVHLWLFASYWSSYIESHFARQPSVHWSTQARASRHLYSISSAYTRWPWPRLGSRSTGRKKLVATCVVHTTTVNMLGAVKIRKKDLLLTPSTYNAWNMHIIK